MELIDCDQEFFNDGKANVWFRGNHNWYEKSQSWGDGGIFYTGENHFGDDAAAFRRRSHADKRCGAWIGEERNRPDLFLARGRSMKNRASRSFVRGR